jgi:DNA-binding HxlR family transcriptional regulator
MATTRTYADRCGVSRALDAIGERWSLLLVRELLLGPKRFTDLREGIPKATPNVLSDRLRELERRGVLERRRLGPPARAHVYELTSRGLELEPVILALGRWGSACPLDAQSEMSVDSHALALRTLFDPAAARELELRIELRLESDQLSAAVANGSFTLTRGEVRSPDAVITARRPALRSVLWEGRALRQAVATKEVSVNGDLAAAERFLALFPRPPRPIP